MRSTIPVLLMAAVLAGCDHPLDIVGGEGDILSASGERDCLLENLPCVIEVVEAYDETYFAEPRAGYEFVGWDNCLVAQDNSCSFNIPENIVEDNWGNTMPALVAKFAPLCAGAPSSSFGAIQTAIFNAKGCTASACHDGNGPQAGLNLTTGNSYAEIVNVTAQSGGGLKLVLPGDATNSYLYRKVSAKTRPGSFSISGSPMPVVGSALSDDQLTALALWIDAGAPQSGRASEFREVEQLLGFCDP